MRTFARLRDSSRRQAFTLLELILVLAVLVAAVSISIPVLVGPLEGQRVLEAADQVRAAFNRARVQAMRSGQTHLFRFQPGTNYYIVEAVNSGEDYLEASPEAMAAMSRMMTGGTTRTQPRGALDAEDFEMGAMKPEEIAENTMFASVANLHDLRSARVLEQLQVGGAAQQLSDPILFYPDGTSSTTQLVLTNQQQQFVVVRLRGLTGMTQVSELLSPEEVPQ